MDKDTKQPRLPRQPRYQLQYRKGLSGSQLIRAIARMQEQCEDFDDQVAKQLELPNPPTLLEILEAMEAHEACGDK